MTIPLTTDFETICAELKVNPAHALKRISVQEALQTGKAKAVRDAIRNAFFEPPMNRHDRYAASVVVEVPEPAPARRQHRHRAVPTLRQEKKWQYCIDHEACNRNPKRQQAHGNLHVTDQCSCGAVREAEIGIFQTNYGEWK